MYLAIFHPVEAKLTEETVEAYYYSNELNVNETYVFEFRLFESDITLLPDLKNGSLVELTIQQAFYDLDMAQYPTTEFLTYYDININGEPASKINTTSVIGIDLNWTPEFENGSVTSNNFIEPIRYQDDFNFNYTIVEYYDSIFNSDGNNIEVNGSDLTIQSPNYRIIDINTGVIKYVQYSQGNKTLFTFELLDPQIPTTSSEMTNDLITDSRTNITLVTTLPTGSEAYFLGITGDQQNLILGLITLIGSLAIISYIGYNYLIFYRINSLAVNQSTLSI